jgi:hypothetical protein
MKKFTVSIVMLLLTTVSFAQGKFENLKIFWPAEYKFKPASNQNTAQAQMLELIPGNETLNNWSIMGTMICMKGVRTVPVLTFAQTIFNKLKASAPKATMRVIEDGSKAKNSYVIFKIEAPAYVNSPKPESQLYYVIQGNQSLFNNFVAVKQPYLGPLLVEKWVKIFKASKLVYN